MNEKELPEEKKKKKLKFDIRIFIKTTYFISEVIEKGAKNYNNLINYDLIITSCTFLMFVG